MTTTAQWSGPSVGIVRVERELARRARRFLGKQVSFCFYDRSRAAVLALDDPVADDIIDGRVRIRMVVRSPLRQKIRRAVMRNATLYHFLQAVRGRSYSREQILQIQGLELTGQKPRPGREAGTAFGPAKTESARLIDLPHERARLDAETMVISGGLDWQYKDMRALWHLKQTCGFSYCAIVYDLIPVFSPHFVSPAYVELVTDYFGELGWLADLTMCISQATRQEWLRHLRAIGEEPVAASTFPLGCDLSPHGNDAGLDLPAALQGKFFALYVSTIEPRKNHFMLYQAWEECIRTKEIDPERHRLVLVGRQGWAAADFLHEVSTNPLTKDTIVILRDVGDEQLTSLYRGCAFVLFPSLYEGFGLPLAEALGYGKPCVSSNAGALAEVGGDLVIRLDPKDTLAWSRTIARLMSSPSELEGWEARIRQMHRPITWDDAARCFFDAVREPVGKVRHDLGADGENARTQPSLTEVSFMKQGFGADTKLRHRPLSAAIAVAKAFGQLHDGVVVPDYELLLSKGYRRFLCPGQVVFDIGSHAGLHLAQFVDLIGASGRAVAFEPIPALAHDLAKRYRNRSNVDIRNIALSDKTGRSEFLVLHKAIGMSGFKQRANAGEQGAEKITVEMDTLDRQAAKLRRLDYIKMDIEGAEIACLRGASETVDRHRPIISVEYGMPGYSMFGHTAMTLFEWACEHGYIPSDLFGNLIPEPDDWAVVCDYSLWDFFLVPKERREEWAAIF